MKKYWETLEKVYESLENIGNDIYATSSAYDIKNWLINKPKSYKIIYDNTLKYYFIANGMEHIHSEMFYKAVKNGFYPDLVDVPQNELFADLLEMEEYEEMCCFCFDPDGDSLVDFDRCDDGYPIKHVYSFGAIYERFTQGFSSFCPLFEILGNPIRVENLGE